MDASLVLTDIAVMLVALSVWNDLRAGGRDTPARRTWLTVAAIFAAVSGLLRLFG